MFASCYPSSFLTGSDVFPLAKFINWVTYCSHASFMSLELVVSSPKTFI